MLSKLLPKLRSALVCTLSLLATASLAQTTIHVGPGQTYTTIQSGIDAANAGDTVLVAPGTYNENINFNGKAITVTSSGGATKTTIDGGNKPGLATVVFASGEMRASIISGFTIRGGGDTTFAGASDGGVYINQSAPTVQGNIITANICHNIHAQQSPAAILNNEISGVLPSGQDVSIQSYCDFQSAILSIGTYFLPDGLGTIITGNTIENNLYGSAINLWASQNVLILNNTIRNNISPDPGSAFTSSNSYGTVITQNLIYKNTSTCGGAIGFDYLDPGYGLPSILIMNNTLVDNLFGSPETLASECTPISQIYPNPYGLGNSGPDAVIVNNIVSGSTSSPAVNCSWYNPQSEPNQPLFKNDLLQNTGGPFFGSYCVDVSQKYNNITADPQFVNSSQHDYNLEGTSPAIDAGDITALETFTAMTGMKLSQDFAGNPRVADVTGNGCNIDIGAYEYPSTRNDCGVSETLKSSLNPAQAGQSVTFTAQLTSQTGEPTGLIEFLDGTTLLASQAVSSTGSAAFTTSTLTVGTHSITANYQPTGSFSSSSASLTQVIAGVATGTALTCLPNSIHIGNTAQLTATVTSASGAPTGSIAFTDNGASLASKNLLNGATSLTYTGSVAGTHTITATYAPTGAFAASSASCSEVVNALPTTSMLTVTPATSTYGPPITLTASVSPATPPGPSIPTGTVTFLNGASVIASGTLSGGLATLASRALPGGVYTLTCMYSGSSIYAASNCNSVPVTVNAAPTALTLTSSKSPAPYGTTIAFTVRLTVNGQSAGSGNTLRLNINSQTATLTTDATGSATYTIATLPPNTYPVNASFAGTNDLLASSASLTEVVTPDPTSITLTGSPNPGDVNQQVTLTSAVSSPVNQVPSGKVTFYDGATSLGSSQLSATGEATLATSFSTAGVHNLTATYDGNADLSTSTSPVLKETIVAGDFSIAVKPGSATVYTGIATTVQVTVTSLRGFDQPLSLACSGLPANTTCTFTPASLPQGQGTANLVIQTTAPHKAEAASAAAVGALALLLLPLWKRRRYLSAFSTVLLAIAFGIGLAGCSSVKPITGGTPPGAYNVAVTATTGPATPLTHSAIVTLTVKSLF